jgi:hypothetical protein
LGYGMGWWGMIYAIFGNKAVPTTIWVEVMWTAWVFDGGFPLLILYFGAITLAIRNSVRIALRTRDRDLGFWATVIAASNLSTLATCFSYPTFLTPIGVEFWFLSAALHAADFRLRAAASKVKPRVSPSPLSPPRVPPYPMAPPPR